MGTKKIKIVLRIINFTESFGTYYINIYISIQFTYLTGVVMLLCAIVVHFTKRKGLRYVSKFWENAWIFGDSVVDAKARGWINWIMIPNMSNLAKGFFNEYKRNKGRKVFLSKPCNEAYKGTGVCRDQDHQDYAYPDASAESKS